MLGPKLDPDESLTCRRTDVQRAQLQCTQHAPTGGGGVGGEGLSLRKGDTVQGLDAALDRFKNSKVNDKLHVSP